MKLGKMMDNGMKIILIRHGMTKGNLEKRYVGTTDESILASEEKKLRELENKYETVMRQADYIFTSPMKRCVETAHILFPDKDKIVVDGFRECDFGDFEYMNYEELNGNAAYKRYIDSNGEAAFPNGESKEVFANRCIQAFEETIRNLAKEDCTIALVVHGGTIMALLDAYSNPHKSYFDWQTKNGTGYIANMNVVKDENGNCNIAFFSIENITL